MSIASDLAALGATLKSNLEAKGITGLNSNMGLTTLANKILNISTNSGIKLQLYYTYPDGWVGKLTQNGVGIANANVVVHEYSWADQDNFDYVLWAPISTDQNGEIILPPPASMPSLVRYVLEYNGVFSNIVEINDVVACYDSGSGVSNLYISATDDIVGEGDTLSIEARVTDSNGNGLIGEVVTFSFYQNNSVFDTFEIVTDSYGDAVCEYIGQNRGDVTVVVECMSLQETYVLSDIRFYDKGTVDNSSLYTKSGNVTITQDSDHYVLVSSTSNCFLKLPSLPSEFRVELEVKSNKGGGVLVGNGNLGYGTGIGVYNEPSSTLLGVFTNNGWSRTAIQVSNVLDTTHYFRYIITRTGTNVNVTIKDASDNTVFNENATVTTVDSVQFFMNNQSTYYLKEIKIISL